MTAVDSGLIYRPDLSIVGKVRRRVARLQHRRPAQNQTTIPMVSFAFDDALASAITVGGDILERRGLRGTYFISAALARQLGHLGRYAGLDEVQDASRRGHEIACHTYSHLDCGQADGPAIIADLDRNRDAFAAAGLPDPETFAYPYGDVSARAKQAAADRFRLARALHRGLITPGVDLNQAPAVGVEGAQGEALGRTWLKRARAKGGWLILFTHGVVARPDSFSATVDGFTRLVDEAMALGLEVVTVAEGARRLGGRA